MPQRLLLIFITLEILLSPLAIESFAGSSVGGESSASTPTIKISPPPVTSYECFVDAEALITTQETFQLVDIRSEESRGRDPVSAAWPISLQSLRNMPHLKNHAVLIVGENFSRVVGAEQCALLKSGGFTQVKVLIGGAQAWINYHRPQNGVSHISNFVSPRDFLFEYFVGQVATVATTKEIASNLKSLGIDAKYPILESSNSKSLELELDKIILQHADPLVPLVIVGEIGRLSFLKPQKNLYVLSGGVGALKAQIIKNQLSLDSVKQNEDYGICSQQ